jgi:hypothetical protein
LLGLLRKDRGKEGIPVVLVSAAKNLCCWKMLFLDLPEKIEEEPTIPKTELG